jgi:hypothetical protein
MTYARRDPQVARGIRRVRLERGWTLREVALLLGCDPSRICRIENGERGTRPSGSGSQARRTVAVPDGALPAMRLPAPRTGTCACAAARRPARPARRGFSVPDTCRTSPSETPIRRLRHYRERSARPSASQNGIRKTSDVAPLPNPAVYENQGGDAPRRRAARAARAGLRP